MNENRANKPQVVIRLSHMGDVALTTGVLARWHEQRGETFVFITRPVNAPLLENHPAIERVVILDKADLTTLGWIRKSRELAREFAGQTLIDLHGTLRSRILSFFWKGPFRRYPKFSLERRRYAKTHLEKYKQILEAANVPQRYAMAQEGQTPAQNLLLPRIFLTDAEKEAAKDRLSGIETGAPLVALHPYATHISKQWPRPRWNALVAMLDEAGIPWIVVGRDEEPLLTGDERDFTNTTDIRETCALLDRASLLVTGDSGPMHLASGVGTPVLALFGPTVKAWGFFPSGPNDRILERDLACRPCSLHGGGECDKKTECLVSIPPEEVMRNVREMVD